MESFAYFWRAAWRSARAPRITSQTPLEPFCLGFEEHEGAGDDLSRIAVMTEFDLALDALFGYGIEGEVHGESLSVELLGG